VFDADVSAIGYTPELNINIHNSLRSFTLDYNYTESFFWPFFILLVIVRDRTGDFLVVAYYGSHQTTKVAQSVVTLCSWHAQLLPVPMELAARLGCSVVLMAVAFTDKVERSYDISARTAWLTVKRYRFVPMRVKFGCTKSIQSTHPHCNGSAGSQEVKVAFNFITLFYISVFCHLYVAFRRFWCYPLVSSEIATVHPRSSAQYQAENVCRTSVSQMKTAWKKEQH
jgi:hypothetical protein